MAELRTFHDAGREITGFALERKAVEEQLNHELGFEQASVLMKQHPEIFPAVTKQRIAMRDAGALYEQKGGDIVLVGRLNYDELGLGNKLASELKAQRHAHEIARRAEKLNKKWPLAQRDIPSDSAEMRAAGMDVDGEGYGAHPHVAGKAEGNLLSAAAAAAQRTLEEAGQWQNELAARAEVEERMAATEHGKTSFTKTVGGRKTPTERSAENSQGIGRGLDVGIDHGTCSRPPSGNTQEV